MRERVGPFRILRTLGEGGMGIVYEASDDRVGRRVALKMLLPSAEGPISRERLRREARAAASVKHPHVCEVYEVGEGDELYVAMELLEGESLSARIARGPIPVVEAVSMALEMLSALGALHALEILHRDLKPSNVFLTSNGVKLLDFGLALAIPEGATVEQRLTLTGTVLGTPQYMAPERWTGDGHVAAESDLFAVGALLFEMVTGRLAFSGRSAVDIARAILSDPSPRLEGGPGIEVLDRVLRTALEKVPAKRFPTASAMSVALTEARDALTGSSTAIAGRSVTRLLVLPFRLLRDADSDIAFLGPGIADAVTTALSGLPSLVMRSPHAAARFSGAAPGLDRLGNEFAVDAVLVGTLLRSGDRLRMSAQPERTVEHVFRRRFCVTPMGYLAVLRLDSARRALLRRGTKDTDVSVARVAQSVGFPHLGRFAAAYRRLYGETPRETHDTLRTADRQHRAQALRLRLGTG